MENITAIPARNIKPFGCPVVWSVIIAGALAAAAISLILLILGSALGFSSVSPWSHSGTIASFSVKTAIWLIVMQWIAAGLGGFLTGRLRHPYDAGLSRDEAFFRDTAHGFLAWALATLLTATVLASAASWAVNGAAHGAAMMAAAAPERPMPPPPHEGGPMDENTYIIDSLLRPAAPTTASASGPDTRAEVTRILMTGLKNGSVPDADKAYLSVLVSARAGIRPSEASRRVDDVITQLEAQKAKMKQAADEARHTATHISLYLFLSLLIGAFIASSAAAVGGQHRDELTV